jgi:pregnancy-associated plasma protein-A
MRGLRISLMTCAALVITLALGALPVAADPYGTGGVNTGWFPDDAQQSYCWGSNFTHNGFRTAADGRMANLDTQTAMSRLFVATCTTSTDVRFELMSGNNGFLGDYFCEYLIGNVCYRARIRLNTTYLTDNLNRRATACHEIGHSVGLTHGGTTDCMKSGFNTVENSKYNSHHVSHINAYVACLSNPVC